MGKQRDALSVRALLVMQKQWQIDENLAKVLKEHQWEGVRHMWYNVVLAGVSNLFLTATSQGL